MTTVNHTKPGDGNHLAAGSALGAGRRRRLRLALAIAVGTAMVAGCSRANDQAAPTVTQAETTTLAPATQPTTPASGSASSTSGPPTTTASGPADEPASSGEAVAPTGEPIEVAAGLVTPWSVVFVGGAPVVSERDTGRLLEILADGTVREMGVVEDLRPDTAEGGLLGLAVDPDNRLYAYSNGTDGGRIQRFDVTGPPGALELGPPDTIVGGLPSGTFHNGGRIAFGPDGMLYLGVGDTGQRQQAQNLESLAGKILRLTRDGEVPADNPFPGSYVYSYGHRNVQGLAWAADGTMFASEFGQDTWDELNVIVAGGNYGWPIAEGGADSDEFVDPVQQWTPAEASPSGIAIVDGTIFVANLRGEVLRAVPVADPAQRADYYQSEFGRIRAVAQGPDGRLWFVTGNTGSRMGDPRAGDDRVLSVELDPNP